MKKEEDKRLLIPKDGFEEEASEGLGKLNREEAEADLRELRGKIERRVRRPRMIWLPAAAAVVILLVASAVYIALFRNRNVTEPEIAVTGVSVTDTALIAMAQPIRKTESVSRSRAAKSAPGVVSVRTTDELTEAKETDDKIAEGHDEVSATLEVVEGEEVAAGEVMVEAMPRMEKAAPSEKKDKAAAATTREDSAVATPSPGTGISDRQAAPVGGMVEFNKWINRNIRYPEGITTGVRKVVVVAFKVAADSTVYDLRVEQSEDDRYAAEVFRLLREGPKWVPAVRDGRAVPEEVRVSIVFK